MKRKRMTVSATSTDWRRCPECGKSKPHGVGVQAGGGRWYCSQPCMKRGERMYHGKK